MKLACLMPLTVENIVTARKLGYDALEALAGWRNQPPLAQIEADLPALREALAQHKIGVTAVAIYGGTIETPIEEAAAYWERAMAVARQVGCSVVAGMTGRDNSRSVEDNLPAFQTYFARIARSAEERGVRIALEPWPGMVTGHGPYRWANLASTPELWARLFEAVPSPALGLEYDASHLVWQGIDPLQAIRDFGKRIHHVHAKDILIDEALLRRTGVHGRGWWRFVIPGLGQINWPEILAALKEVGYRGDLAVEHEDREYLDRRWNEGLTIALKTLRPLVDTY
ncbi:MAG: sugar phosphate isomerase/epimerase [Chloroflexota bacterium]